MRQKWKTGVYNRPYIEKEEINEKININSNNYYFNNIKCNII